MNAFIPSVTRASYNRRRDLVAPTVSKMIPAFRHPFHPPRQTGQCKMVDATSAKNAKNVKTQMRNIQKINNS